MGTGSGFGGTQAAAEAPVKENHADTHLPGGKSAFNPSHVLDAQVKRIHAGGERLDFEELGEGEILIRAGKVIKSTKLSHDDLEKGEDENPHPQYTTMAEVDKKYGPPNTLVRKQDLPKNPFEDKKPEDFSVTEHTHPGLLNSEQEETLATFNGTNPQEFAPAGHDHEGLLSPDQAKTIAQAVIDDDSRLSDARPPVPHSHKPEEVEGRGIDTTAVHKEDKFGGDVEGTYDNLKVHGVPAKKIMDALGGTLGTPDLDNPFVTRVHLDALVAGLRRHFEMVLNPAKWGSLTTERKLEMMRRGLLNFISQAEGIE